MSFPLRPRPTPSKFKFVRYLQTRHADSTVRSRSGQVRSGRPRQQLWQIACTPRSVTRDRPQRLRKRSLGQASARLVTPESDTSPQKLRSTLVMLELKAAAEEDEDEEPPPEGMSAAASSVRPRSEIMVQEACRVLK